MKASEFIKRFDERRKRQEAEEEGKEKPDHSLQAQAKERAGHPDDMHTGTAFDWEDMDAYKRELERLEREGPGKKGPQHPH